jgi:LysR family transcriptional regulator, nitrogen assimilation regulatory protein
MDLKQLRYFVQVASLGGFNRAADTLRIAQPALSRQVRLLEVELGVKLLERSSRGVRTTAAGNLLLSQANIILTNADAIKESLRALGTQALQGRVSVGMPSRVSNLMAVSTRQSVADEHPGVEVRIFEGFSAFLHDMVLNGSLDIAVVYGSFQDPRLHYQPIVREDLYLIVSSSDPIAKRSAIDAAEMASMTLVLPHRPHIRRDAIDAAGVVGYKTIAADMHSLLLHHVISGDGASVLPLKSVERELAEGLVAAIPIQSPELTQVVSLCWPEKSENIHQIRAVVTLLRDEALNLVASGAWPGIAITQTTSHQAL